MNIQRTLFKSTALSALFLLFFNTAVAQWPTSYETGTITSDYCVSIDATKAVVEYYKIDITALNFASAVDAQKVFGAISNNYLSYKVDFPNQAVYLQIHLDRTQYPQDVAWWSNYLAERCSN